MTKRSTAAFAGMVLAATFGLMLPRLAHAQSTGSIAGNVKDATGAVLPGVTVEASSPALIEKVRTVVSDDQGNYKIVDLRPGTYVVTFSLTGFSTVKREGVELSAGFTAVINGELTVGSVEETITVTSASPIVDLQNSRGQQVLKAETMDALPSGMKNPAQFASMTLGAMPSTQGRNDVGGDKGEQSTGIMLHGGRGDDSKANWDGMNTNVFFGNGGGQMRVYYFNTVSVQEVVIDTSGNTSESETGGANLNMVPKDGGNTFKVYGTAGYTTNGLSAKAISDDDVARGLSPQSSLKRIYDYGVGVGGPILKDRLWFYASNRWWGSQNYGIGNYFNQSSNPNLYVPDTTRPAYADTFFVDNAVRVSWRISDKHKITQDEHVQHGCSCWLGIGGGAQTAPEASTDFMYGPQVLSQTSWTFTATNRLLIQGGATFLKQNVSYVNGAPDDTAESAGVLTASKFTGIGTPVFPTANAITDLSTGYTWGAMTGGLMNYSLYNNSNNYNQRLVASYITGSHAFKAGLQTLQGHYDFNGMTHGVSQVNYTFRSGAPVSLTEWAGPFLSLSRLRGVGVFVQDQWTVNKLTLNLGVRFDSFTGRTLPLTTPAGPFVAAREVPGRDNLPNFKDITPRLGAAYDLFGNGKTAIKVAFGRYLFSQGGNLSQQFSPATSIVTSATRTWNDNTFPAGDPRNGNFSPDCDLVNRGVNGECGALSNAAFGQPFSNINIARDASEGWGAREFSYQTSVQLQHELRPGIGIAVGYFRTAFGNLTVTQNTATLPADYTEYCVTAPTDPHLPGGGGHQICGLYNVNPSKFGQVNNLVTRATAFGKPVEQYSGVDLGFNARWGRGALLQGGVTIGRETVDYCYANGRPDLTPEYFPANYPRSPEFCHVVSSWWNGIGSQIKLQGVYPLPADFQVSATYKNLPGIPTLANLVLTNAQVAPALGRDLSACPATGVCNATVTTALLKNASNGNTTVSAEVYDLRLNQVDLRLTRAFHFGRSRVQPTVDLYNAFNSRIAQGIVTTYGPTWRRPTSLLGGRLLKFGAQVDF